MNFWNFELRILKDGVFLDNDITAKLKKPLTKSAFSPSFTKSLKNRVIVAVDRFKKVILEMKRKDYHRK